MFLLFDRSHTLAGEYLSGFAAPWEALPGIGGLIRQLGRTLPQDFIQQGESVWIHKTVSVAGTAQIAGPCIIGANTQIRPGAFLRGNALIGEDCVVGNSTELKNAILFDGVQVPHFNYIGDSILGYKAHFGAGAITSNVKSDKSPVVCGGINTGMKKLGAMIGDFAEIGCNSVLNPGTVIGRHSTVYPLSCVRGCVPEGCIYKDKDHLIRKV